MTPSRLNPPDPPARPTQGWRPLRNLFVACLLIIFIALLLPRPRRSLLQPAPSTNGTTLAHSHAERAIGISWSPPASHSPTASAPLKTAEEIVAGKLAQFARSRRDLAYALARRHEIQVPEEVNRFFDAVESDNWEEIEARFQAINGHDSSAGSAPGRPPGVRELWPAIIDAYGAAEQAHLWPAQALLDYGNAVLNALDPGMVYVGGTDNGRWIPELLNDTSDAERHIIVTQNALADATYLDYVTQLYGDRLTTPTEEESQRAFQDYIADAQKRLLHDQQFPDEPKQIRPGEEVTAVDGHIQVSGQAAVMQINENLLQMLMQKNQGLAFAIQESFPLKGTYADAVPLGPLMQLNAADAQSVFTPENAAACLDYWRATAENVLADPDTAGSAAALKSYSHDANSAANLLAAHNFTAEAEQAYRLSSQLWPGNPEAAGGLATILASTGRADEARQLADDFGRNYPDQRTALENLWSATVSKGH